MQSFFKINATSRLTVAFALRIYSKIIKTIIQFFTLENSIKI